MDLNRLRHLVAFARIGNLRETSQVLGITLSALSKSLQTLEEQLGGELFFHEGRTLRLTPGGRRLVHSAEELLQKADAVFREASSAGAGKAQQAMPLRIGSFEVFTTWLLPRILSGLRAGEVEVQVREMIPGEMERGLLEREVDWTLTYLPIPTPGIEHVEAGSFSMGIFGRADRWPDAFQENLPFVVPTAPVHGSPTRVRGLDGWPDDRISRKISHRVELMETALSFVRSGACVAYLPHFVAKTHNQVVSPEFRLAEISCPFSRKVARQRVFIGRRRDEMGDDRELRRWLRALKGACSLN